MLRSFEIFPDMNALFSIMLFSLLLASAGVSLNSCLCEHSCGVRALLKLVCTCLFISDRKVVC